MKHLLSIFSFKTPRFTLRLTGSIVVCLCVLIAAEAAARLAVYKGFLQEMPSLKKLVHEHIENVNLRRPDLWLVGNSVLKFGIDEDYLKDDCQLNTMKFYHGGATLSGSAAMLDFYLQKSDYKPRHVLLIITKDDLNTNGLNSRTSKKYLDFMAWRKHFQFYSFLRSVRGTLYDKAVLLYGRIFVSPKKRHEWRLKHQFIQVRFDIEKITQDMMDNFSYSDAGFKLLANVSRKHAISDVTVLLMPITEKYVQWHDREHPDVSYEMIRKRIKADCEQWGLGYIDLGTPPDETGLFADYFHLNDRGCAYMTPIVSREICSRIKPQR